MSIVYNFISAATSYHISVTLQIIYQLQRFAQKPMLVDGFRFADIDGDHFCNYSLLKLLEKTTKPIIFGLTQPPELQQSGEL
jgi:hypothetical protein